MASLSQRIAIAAHSNVTLLDAFVDLDYLNEIGPGVWHIHSPLLPTVDKMVERPRHALAKAPAERPWVTPGGGLNARGWLEVTAALEPLVGAVSRLRNEQLRR